MKIGILGAGESGVGAALLAKKQNCEVFVSEGGNIQTHFLEELTQNQIPFEQGQHSLEILKNCDWIVKSPGIPPTADIIALLKNLEKPIISEIEFAGKFLQKAKVIGITGSNGKTTTTLLIAHLLEKVGKNIVCCGNVGKSFARVLAEGEKDFFVLELSSFQLEDMYEFHNHIAVFTNISPDHLDRYHYQIELYAQSKWRITQNQNSDDFFVFWKEDPWISQQIKKHPLPSTILDFSHQSPSACLLSEQGLMIDWQGKKIHIPRAKMPLQGKHNDQNTAAAILAVLAVGVEVEAILTHLPSFVNAPHRLFQVRALHEIVYINDSKATNVDAAFYALDAQKKPIIWIVGGVDKGNDYRQVLDLVQAKVKVIIALGKDNQKIIAFFQGKIPVIESTDTMQKAVEKAQFHAQKGDVVLLSPCCASFDLFKNYEHRGQCFEEAVWALK